jgi:hypothetical protein
MIEKDSTIEGSIIEEAFVTETFVSRVLADGKLYNVKKMFQVPMEKTML